jgi:hypothetical protein
MQSKGRRPTHHRRRKMKEHCELLREGKKERNNNNNKVIFFLEAGQFKYMRKYVFAFASNSSDRQLKKKTSTRGRLTFPFRKYVILERKFSRPVDSDVCLSLLFWREI